VNNDTLLYALARKAQQQAIRKRRRQQQRRMTAGPVRDHEPQLSPTQKRGRQGEDQARAHLEAHGLIIIAQNLQGRSGEIDLVAVHGNVLVFVEVRARGSLEYGGAAASVNRQKQRRLIRTAHCFLPRLATRYFGGAIPPCRFDVVSLEPAGTAWIRNAFAL
jgi:putative endonuclease